MTIDVHYLAKQHLQARIHSLGACHAGCVARLDGNLAAVVASLVLPLPPKVAYAIITHPENEKLFRHLESCTHHEVLERDDPHGRVVVESEHVAMWRFLAFSGRVRTRLRIEQDHRQLISTFQLVPGRFNLLRLFEGRWSVEAQPPAPDGGDRCLLTLEQQLRPAYFLPPPLGSLLKQVTSRQLQGIFHDLRQEADRINQGRPTLWGGLAAAGTEAPPDPPATPEELEQPEPRSPRAGDGGPEPEPMAR